MIGETRMGRWHLSQLTACCLLCAFAFALPLPCFGVFVSPMVASFGSTVTEVNLYFTFMTAAAVVSCAFGPRILRGGLRRTVLAASALMTGTYLLLALFPSVAMVWVAGTVAGLAYPLCSSVLAPIVVDRWFAVRQGTFVGIAFALVGLSGVVFGPVLTALIMAHGWQTALAVAALAMLAVCAFSAIVLLRESPALMGLEPYGAHGQTAGSATPDSAVERGSGLGRTFILIGLASVLSGILGDLNTQLNAMAQNSGFDPVAAGIAFSCISAGLFAGKIALGWVRDVRDGRQAVIVGCAAGLLAFAVLSFALRDGGAPMLYGSALLAGFCTCLGTVTPALLCTGAYRGEAYTAAVSRATSLCNLGMALGAPAYSMTYDITGSYAPVALGLAAVAALCGAVSLLLMHRS